MNWYKIITSMPLPAVSNYPHDVEHDEHGGMRRIDNRLDQEIADEFTQQHPDAQYLGHGSNGIAYQSAGVVQKITSQEDEYRAAERLIGNPIPCVVEVYFIEEIQYEPALWKITLEKVEPLKDHEFSHVEAISNYRYSMRDPNQEMKKMTDEEMIQTLLEKPYMDRRMTRACFAKYKKMIMCLAGHGLDITDAGPGNIGINNNGDYVMLDLGYLS